jgi:hypothetical protein
MWDILRSVGPELVFCGFVVLVLRVKPWRLLLPFVRSGSHRG